MTDWKRLFDYDDWANREALGSLRASPAPPEKSRKWLAHIAGAERLWLSRIEGEGPPFPAVWPDLSLDACTAAFDELAPRWRRLIVTLSPEVLARTVAYKNSKEEEWSSALGEILMHVVMHSVYHRGQIAADVRAAGLTPAYTDYIHAVRGGKIGSE